MGHLIPAGTGLAKFVNLHVENMEIENDEKSEKIEEEVGKITETS